MATTDKLIKAAKLHNHKTYWIAGRLVVEGHYLNTHTDTWHATLTEMTNWSVADMRRWLGY